MDAEITFVQKHLRKMAGAIHHKDHYFAYSELKTLMAMGRSKGYTMISQFTDEELDAFIERRNVPTNTTEDNG